MRKVLVTFYTEIGRGPSKNGEKRRNVQKSKKSKKMFSAQNSVLFQKKTVSSNLETFFWVLNLRDCALAHPETKKGQNHVYHEYVMYV